MASNGAQSSTGRDNDLIPAAGNGQPSQQEAPKVRWQEPPARGSRGRANIWVPRLLPLMEQPGRWAIVGEYPNTHKATQAAHYVRKGIVRIPPGRWETRSAKSAPGIFYVYARYLGPEESK